jgi:hypothetical protein
MIPKLYSYHRNAAGERLRIAWEIIKLTGW